MKNSLGKINYSFQSLSNKNKKCKCEDFSTNGTLGKDDLLLNRIIVTPLKTNFEIFTSGRREKMDFVSIQIQDL